MLADIKTRFLLFGFLFVVFSGVIEAFTKCDDERWPYYYICGNDEYCCEQYGENTCCSHSDEIAGGAIAGVVIGAISVFCLICACICACVKTKAKQGVVIHPTNHAHAAFVSTSVHTQHMPPAYGPPMQNNMYGGPTVPSNMYGRQRVAPPPYAEALAAYPPNAPPLGFQTQR